MQPVRQGTRYPSRARSRLLLQPERDFAHETRVLAVREPFGFARDRCEHVAQRLHLRLRIIPEHMRGDEVLPPGSGMADADPHAPELGAETGVDRAQAVMA